MTCLYQPISEWMTQTPQILQNYSSFRLRSTPFYHLLSQSEQSDQSSVLIWKMHRKWGVWENYVRNGLIGVILLLVNFNCCCAVCASFSAFIYYTSFMLCFLIAWMAAEILNPVCSLGWLESSVALFLFETIVKGLEVSGEETHWLVDLFCCLILN